MTRTAGPAEKHSPRMQYYAVLLLLCLLLGRSSGSSDFGRNTAAPTLAGIIMIMLVRAVTSDGTKTDCGRLFCIFLHLIGGAHGSLRCCCCN